MASAILKFLVGLLIFLLTSCGGGEVPEAIAIGSKAPDFSLKSIDGTKVKSH